MAAAPVKKRLFEVQMGHGGHRYIIYTNGEIEGFGDGCIIFNYFFTIVADLLAEERAA